MIPLFPSYVFFCGGDDERYRALSTHRICQVIEVRDREQFVAELSAVEKALQCGSPLEFYPFAAVGKRCRIAHGPLQGFEGVVVKAKGMARLVLHVSILGQSAAVEIDVDVLEAAE